MQLNYYFLFTCEDIIILIIQCVLKFYYKMNIAFMNKSYDSVTSLPVYEGQNNHPVIEVHVSCKNLIKLDIGSESDPMCVFFAKENDKYIEIDRTEVINNDPNPNFVHSFKTFYIFESHQPIRFEVYDSDSKNSKLKKHDFIGYYNTDVQQLVSNLDQSLTFELQNDETKSKRGTIILTCNQTKDSTIQLEGQIRVNNLKKMKTFAKNNPFFEISRPSESGKNIPIFRSETKSKCFSCTFQTFSIPIRSICQNSLDEPITVTFFDYRSRKSAKEIGHYEYSVRNFMETLNTKFDLKGEKAKSVGQFEFLKLEVISKPTFADYLKSGIQLNMITAIDFTISNGNPNSISSLHHIYSSGKKLNQYQKSILAIGSILEKYDRDQKFPVFGFGAHFDNSNHSVFPLTFDDSNVEVDGIQGIFNAYVNALQKVTLAGPTYFAPVIKQATLKAIENFNTNKTYTILLIMTDGEILDLPETIDAIVDASDCPLSIIIIGVGPADFSKMDELDADDNPLVSKEGITMKRDIVQFVPFNKFKDNMQRLEKEVLAEVPNQIHQYCSSHGLMPQFDKNDDFHL